MTKNKIGAILYPNNNLKYLMKNTVFRSILEIQFNYDVLIIATEVLYTHPIIYHLINILKSNIIK